MELVDSEIRELFDEFLAESSSKRPLTIEQGWAKRKESAQRDQRATILQKEWIELTEQERQYKASAPKKKKAAK